jgi:hypothetical protein
MKKLPIVFAVAFALNWIWEHFHSRLYVNYQGSEITDWILFRSAFFVDATIVTAIVAIFMKVRYLRERPWGILILGLIPAIIMERYAMATARWMYGPHMPVIPFLETGLTPTVQLALTAYIAYKVVCRK